MQPHFVTVTPVEKAEWEHAFADVPDGPIPNETTFGTWGWSATLSRTEEKPRTYMFMVARHRLELVRATVAVAGVGPYDSCVRPDGLCVITVHCTRKQWALFEELFGPPTEDAVVALIGQ